ncbi:MFS transporter [Candidatus Bipolaricaulota bacterium]|nr:MFS transporter [Candidatus Bipolaricaulota bacterium]
MIVLVSAIFLGLAGGGLNGGANALVNDLNPEKRAAALNFLGIFFGFGALLVPLLIGSLLKLTGLRPVILLAAFLSLLPFILFSIFNFPRPKQTQGFPLKDVKKIIGSEILWLGAFILFFQSGNEFSVGGWLSSFFQEKFQLEAGHSALILSGYWLFLILGRLLFSKLLGVVKRETVVLISTGLSLLAMLGMILSPGKIPAVIFALLIGLGFAAIYPTTLSVIGEAFPNYSGTAFSLAIGTGLVGGMLSPWLIGRVSQHYSLTTALFIPVFNLLMILGLQSWLRSKLLKSDDK